MLNQPAWCPGINEQTPVNGQSPVDRRLARPADEPPDADRVVSFGPPNRVAPTATRVGRRALRDVEQVQVIDDNPAGRHVPLHHPLRALIRTTAPLCRRPLLLNLSTGRLNLLRSWFIRRNLVTVTERTGGVLGRANHVRASGKMALVEQQSIRPDCPTSVPALSALLATTVPVWQTLCKAPKPASRKRRSARHNLQEQRRLHRARRISHFPLPSSCENDRRSITSFDCSLNDLFARRSPPTACFAAPCRYRSIRVGSPF
jgi:hypothetical protein